MIYIDMIKNSIKQNNRELSKIYLCGDSKHFKIGQTAQRYMCQRLQRIRQTEPEMQAYTYIEFLGNKAIREFVESSVRLYLQGKGYTLQGNDHFTRKGKVETFKRHFMDIVTIVLNTLEINYSVIVKYKGE